VAQFKRGDSSTCDAPRPEGPKTVAIPDIIDQIHDLILEDGRISAKSIAEQLGISRERFGSIIHEDLDMRMLSSKWVPKCLNADQKRQRCQWCEQLLEFSSDAEVIAAAETLLDGKQSDMFLGGLRKLQQRAKKCIELRGEYVE